MSVKIGMEWIAQDWIWKKADEELHPDYINYTKQATGTGMIFWESFRWGKTGPRMCFDLEDEMTVNSTVYQVQLWTESLKEFWEESFGDVEESIVM